MPLILIGAGGHSDDIFDTIGDHIPYKHHSEVPVLAPDDEVVIGINDPALRATVAAELGIQDLNWVHPNAYIGNNCIFGYGCHVNYAASMVRTTLGNHVTVAPGVTICGDVTIGDRVFIGAGAVIVNLTVVPDDTFIKAGTVWTGK